MDNMQRLHECKDSRDDHYQNRRVRRRTRLESEEFTASSGELPDEDEDDLEEEILDHLSTLDNKTSQKNDVLQQERDAVLRAVTRSGLLGQSTGDVHVRPPAETRPVFTDSSEADWRRTYDERRSGWKKTLKSCTVSVAALPLSACRMLSGNRCTCTLSVECGEWGRNTVGRAVCTRWCV